MEKTEPTTPVKEELPSEEDTQQIEAEDDNFENIAARDENLEEIPADINPPVSIEEPEVIDLKLLLDGPKSAQVGEAFGINANVTNSGNQNSTEYQLRFSLPEGLSREDNPIENTWVEDFSALTAGGESPYSFNIMAEQTGSYIIESELLVKGSTVDNGVLEVLVEGKPSIGLSIEAPKRVSLGNKYQYLLKIRNTGSAVLRDIVLQNKMDTSKELIYEKSEPEADKYNNQSGVLTWKGLGNLEIGEERQIKIFVSYLQDGIITNRAQVRNSEKTVTDRATSKVEIFSEIGLQVNHTQTKDPVVVGDTTTFVIEISNQGYKKATDVQLVDIIPEESEFVEAQTEGSELPLDFQQKGKEIIFEPLPELMPGKSITYRVTVKVNDPGDLVNEAVIRSKDFQKAIRKQEGVKSFEKLPGMEDDTKDSDPLGDDDPLSDSDPLGDIGDDTKDSDPLGDIDGESDTENNPLEGLDDELNDQDDPLSGLNDELDESEDEENKDDEILDDFDIE